MDLSIINKLSTIIQLQNKLINKVKVKVKK